MPLRAGTMLRSSLLSSLLTLLLSPLLGPRAYAQPGPTAARLQPAQLAVVINDADPDSVAIGEYYGHARGISAANMVHVSIPGKPARLDPAQFAALRATINGQLSPAIQAVLMVWTAPYAVDCNGITAAFTLGYDAAQCVRSCAAGKPSPYFNAAVARPFTDMGMRLSMLLPVTSQQAARALIDRGVASGFRIAPATAYYLHTSETARNARTPLFPPPASNAALKLSTRTLRTDVLEGASDIMVYQTGVAKVDKLASLGFLPGALADHLTSYGGDLLGTYQMSSLRWLDAGVTASYGTVSEPCNHWQKFPHPTVLLKHYTAGVTAIEAYWRSVAWPAQGVFIGEPLAAPYGR